MPNLGTTELIIVLVIILVIFGAGKLPQVGDALGKAVRDFRKGQQEEEEETPAPTQSATSTATDESEGESASKA